VLIFFFEDAVDGGQELQVVDLQTCFLQQFACRAGLEGFAEFKVSAG
jgi:hypothetical protein